MRLPSLYFAERGTSGSIHHTRHYYLDAADAEQTSQRLSGYWEEHPAARPCLLADHGTCDWSAAETTILRALSRGNGLCYLTGRKNSPRPEDCYRLESLGVVRCRELTAGEEDRFFPSRFSGGKLPRSTPECAVELTTVGRKWLLLQS